MDICENCDESLTEDDGIYTADDVLLCAVCYQMLADDLDCHGEDCECELCGEEC